jgi:hypothetical protein
MRRMFARIIVVTLAATGCAPEESPEEAAEHAVASMSAVTLEGALLAASTRALKTEGTPDRAARETVDGIDAILRPEDVPQKPKTCVSATADGAKVAMHLESCDGPRGLYRLSGDVRVVYGVGLRGLMARMTAEDLRVDRWKLNMRAEARRASEGPREILEAVTDAAVRGLARRDFRRRGRYVLSWTEDAGGQDECVSVDGEWSTTVAETAWSTQVIGVQRCGRGCPDAGQIIHENTGADVSITITFDGSRDAAWTTSRGERGTLLLECSP